MGEGVHRVQRYKVPFEKNATDFWKNSEDSRTFFNIRIDNWGELVGDSNIPNSLLGYAIYLATFMHYDNVLYEKQGDRIPLLLEDLPKILNKSESTVKREVKKLKKTNLIKDKVITFNNKEYEGFEMSKQYFYRGKYSEGKKDTAKTFNDTVRQVYHDNNPTTVAFIAKLIPFIHKTSNILCTNPTANLKYESLSHLRVVDIAAITGLSEKQTGAMLNKTKFNNIGSFARTTILGKVLYKMNPDLATKQRGVTVESVRAEFTSKENKFTVKSGGTF